MKNHIGPKRTTNTKPDIHFKTALCTVHGLPIARTTTVTVIRWGGYPKYGEEMIGAFCGKENTALSYLNNSKIDALADIVKEDLSKLGNVCIMKTKVRSNAVNTPAVYNVICLRITTGGQYRDFTL